jgi:hypothetical protein
MKEQMIVKLSPRICLGWMDGGGWHFGFGFKAALFALVFILGVSG